MFEQQIKNLIKNVPRNINGVPLNLDIVLEGGGFNGSYEIGVMYFLYELEKQNIIKINRISGASIGSIVGLCYLTNNLNTYIEKYQNVRDVWRESINLKEIHNVIEYICNNIDDELFEIIKDDKLYITYYNFDSQKQIIKSTYENKEDLINSLIKSCYLPYLIDNNVAFKCEQQFFIDGGQPFIFHNREKNNTSKILYISINQIKKLPKMLIIKNENNVYGRVLYGILDCYNFFMNDYRRTELCSFVNDWTLFDYFGLHIKQILILLVIYLIYYITKATSYISPYLTEQEFYKVLLPIFKDFYKNIILYVCF